MSEGHLEESEMFFRSPRQLVILIVLLLTTVALILLGGQIGSVA